MELLPNKFSLPLEAFKLVKVITSKLLEKIVSEIFK